MNLTNEKNIDFSKFLKSIEYFETDKNSVRRYMENVENKTLYAIYSIAQKNAFIHINIQYRKNIY